MLPGPMPVRECAECGKFFLNQSVLSPGALAFQSFTDGFVEIGAGFARPGYCICPQCGHLEDFHRLHEVGQSGEAWTWMARLRCALGSRRERVAKLLSFWSSDRPVTPQVANESDFLAALSRACQKREFRIRLGLWQLWNQSETISQDEHDFRQNLVRLLELGDSRSPEEMLAMAEAYRHLGRFSEGLDILKPPVPEAELLRARAILALLRTGERAPMRLDGNLFRPGNKNAKLPWEEIPYELYADRFPKVEGSP